MNIRIYRGTHQIGGCCTEITTDKARILIDFGSNLPDMEGCNTCQEMLSVPGVTEDGPECDGIFFTHIHGDHTGEMERVRPEVPIYMGQASKWMMMNVNIRLERYGQDRTAVIEHLKKANYISAGVPIILKDIRITPFYIDHSAFDSYMFLIEADGKRVLHTGDFRGTGFRGRKLIPMLKKYVGQVDWLICEGTLLSRDDSKMKTERELQDDFRDIMKKHKKVFVICSSTNIDRIAGIIRSRPDKRRVIVDIYQMAQLNLVKGTCREYVRLYDFRDVKYTGYGTEESYNKYFDCDSFLCFIRPNSQCARIYDRYADDDTMILYSMWDGYLKGNTENAVLTDFLRDKPYVCIHTSGHATRKTLREVYEAVNPREGIIPIHTEHPDEYKELLSEKKTYILDDREIFRF